MFLYNWPVVYIYNKKLNLNLTGIVTRSLRERKEDVDIRARTSRYLNKHIMSAKAMLQDNHKYHNYQMFAFI